MGRLGSFENQNLKELFTKWGLENYFQKSRVKEMGDGTWSKDGHAKVDMQLEACRVES